jgi:hypothetical protein
MGFQKDEAKADFAVPRLAVVAAVLSMNRGCLLCVRRASAV